MLDRKAIDEGALVNKAIDALSLSYSPYSGFPVGAALLCTDGSVYQGANIENSSYPCGVCAERVALFHAMMDGKSKEDFVALAIVTDTEGVASPCGLCRQVISELFPEEAPIYLGNSHGDIRVTNIGELLPFAFNGDEL